MILKKKLLPYASHITPVAEFFHQESLYGILLMLKEFIS